MTIQLPSGRALALVGLVFFAACYVRPAPEPVYTQSQPVYAQQGQVIVQQGGGSCINTCQYANDGECDDGRPGAHTSACPYGSDCNDCGYAAQQSYQGGGYQQQTGGCYDSCQHARDGECDDGRPGAHTSLCAYGTDCTDCQGGGVYYQGGSCINTCRYANDGECDDGRPGAHTSACAYGTDCNDCGY
jgi:hypothetical protein